jgi:HAD superfamily hydrolase (TIGR01509 family)
VLDAIELVIFDCDGVLVDSEPISNTVLAEALTEEGLPTTLDEALQEYRGLLLSDVRTRAEDKLGRSLHDGWVAEYEHTRAEAFRRELAPIAGAAEAVRRVMAAGLGVCVASQGRLAKTRLTLGLTGLLEIFPPNALFSAESVPRGKPHPDLFLHAASSMGAEPTRCAVVEDTALGVRAAVAAGMLALGYAPEEGRGELEAAGAQTFGHLRELPTLLKCVCEGGSEFTAPAAERR